MATLVAALTILFAGLFAISMLSLVGGVGFFILMNVFSDEYLGGVGKEFLKLIAFLAVQVGVLYLLLQANMALDMSVVDAGHAIFLAAFIALGWMSLCIHCFKAMEHWQKQDAEEESAQSAN